MANPAPVDFLCDDDEHVDRGRQLPDGEGLLTIYEGRWAYCAAGLRTGEHRWTATGGIEFSFIQHRDLPRVRA